MFSQRSFFAFFDFFQTFFELLKKIHLCSNLLSNCSWEALEMKVYSEKSMNVSDVKVTDEDGYLSRSKTITANNKTVKEEFGSLRS